MKRVSCPKCGSEEIKRLVGSYPLAYECGSCDFAFIEGNKSLIDD